VPLVAGQDFEADASHQPARMRAALDGDERSTWNSGGPQRGTETITVTFARARDVSRIELVMPPGSGNYPVRLAIDTVGPDGTSAVLFDGSVLPAFIVGMTTHPRVPVIDLPLGPNESAALRLRQTGQSHVWRWEMAELRLWRR
jgi:hypothetical protein